MGLLKLTLTLFYFFALLPSSLGQDSPQDYIDAHNVARAKVGVESIEWNEEVANYASQYANERMNDCQLLHSRRPYGENIAMNTGEMSGIEAIQMWLDEQQFYDYASNTCFDGEMCGHYTQVVWRNSTRVGCAKVSCSNDGTFITCNYDPPDNFISEWSF